MNLELITFKFCPFGQRVLIALLEKDLAFETKLVDLKRPPAWLARISPLGKVPVLRLDGKAFFDSSVINELLDELYPPSLHPADPEARAHHRGWIAFAGELLQTQIGLYGADSKKAFGEKLKDFRRLIGKLDSSPLEGPFFGGKTFSLLDAAYAPFFLRTRLMHGRYPVLAELITPGLEDWASALLDRPSVVRSVPQGFDRGYRAFVRAKGSWLLRHG